MEKAVLFDLDGVIVDTAKYHYLAWKKLSDELDIEFDKVINERLKGVSRLESLDIILEKSKIVYSEDEKNKFAEQKNKDYNTFLDQLSTREILPGILESLQMLKHKNLRMAIVSSSKNTNKILERLVLKDWFDVICTGYDIAETKPNPEIFTLAAKRLGVCHDECIVVEDAEAGVHGAKLAKMRCIGIGSEEKLKEADIVIPSTKQLSITLQQMIK